MLANKVHILVALGSFTSFFIFLSFTVSRLLERTEDALKSFTNAADILRITHGTSTPFMKELLSKLEEARAEACYKQQSADDDSMIED